MQLLDSNFPAFSPSSPTDNPSRLRRAKNKLDMIQKIELFLYKLWKSYELSWIKVSLNYLSPKLWIYCEIPRGLERRTSASENRVDRWCINEDAEPRRGWTLGGVLARKLVPKEVGGLWVSISIGERNEYKRGCWVSKEGGLWDLISVGEGNKTLFIRVWKPLPR